MLTSLSVEAPERCGKGRVVVAAWGVAAWSGGGWGLGAGDGIQALSLPAAGLQELIRSHGLALALISSAARHLAC